ncbi:flavin reductase family protein [Thalassotalea sediminis]|uniref:flavin reductase family protein n=1 Tax=Thalassotalea sediminis TaxID=1759089 RepID=UPI00257380CB|nr:flavin reductase family protein [Thalassotalea sediminis]
MILNFSEYSASQRYHLMTQTIIPRPIAWALTASHLGTEKQILNLAPFSYFTAISSDPALLMLSVGKKPTSETKDTLTNVLENKKMVIHIANQDQADLVTQTAATLPHDESELSMIAQNELNTVPFEHFCLPRLSQCDIAYGCELYEVKEIGNAPQTLIFVEVKTLYVNKNKVTQDNGRIKICAESISPLARLGANEYAGITKPFTKNRPA